MGIRAWTLLIAVVGGLFILIDSQRKGLKPSMAYGLFLLTVVLPYVVIPLYFLVRPKLGIFATMTGSGTSATKSSDPKTWVLCTRCGHDNPEGAQRCEKCDNHLGL